MSLSYTQRAYGHFTRLPNRQVAGVVLHHSATTNDLTTAQSLGGWHWWIGKTQLYRDVPEAYAAWHCGATDRWRPPWVPIGAGKGKVSDINAVSVGVEICYAPQNGEAPNAFQYDTLRALMADLYERYGELPTVGHGQVDLSRMVSEPTGLDWERAHFSLMRPGGRYFVPKPQPPEVPDVSILTPEQAIAAAQQLWGYRQVPANPDTAIFKSWVDEWRAGRFRGLPLTLELPVEQGVAVQGFDGGAASWVDGKDVSWEG